LAGSRHKAAAAEKILSASLPWRYRQAPPVASGALRGHRDQPASRAGGPMATLLPDYFIGFLPFYLGWSES